MVTIEYNFHVMYELFVYMNQKLPVFGFRWKHRN